MDEPPVVYFAPLSLRAAAYAQMVRVSPPANRVVATAGGFRMSPMKQRKSPPQSVLRFSIVCAPSMRQLSNCDSEKNWSAVLSCGKVSLLARAISEKIHAAGF
ncbi:MAG: hypothetical protein DMF12_09680 [Verrucomicrobia bacterium]|nr:MAG: hypothetical protein AUI05_00460 [Verrucomicrobia bacterium 13_2_20CM_2_54_15_9cls]PYI41628.1 MAG: hypothetical protein DMF12_09680 [Verrucomicrobiota bacterium]PYI68305.1 MAG: hypothetical protein DMF07_01485 [Verrucomicrobiota bacterium]